MFLKIYNFAFMKNSNTINRVALAIEAIKKYIAGVVFVGALLFLSAGSLFYIEAWLLMALLFIPMLVLGIIMLVYSPQLLQQRLSAKEKREPQKLVTLLTSMMFVAGFVVAGLDYRFSLTQMPSWLIVVASIMFLLSYLLYAEVVRENQWLSRTIDVKDNQKVVKDGLYSIVRHPMYTATIVMFISIPLLLGSLWALPLFLVYLPIIVVRIKDEEKLLRETLDGYNDYCAQVRWRLIPFIW